MRVSAVTPTPATVWPTAIGEPVALDTVSVVPAIAPVFGYGYAYPLPADCLRALHDPLSSAPSLVMGSDLGRAVRRLDLAGGEAPDFGDTVRWHQRAAEVHVGILLFDGILDTSIATGVRIRPLPTDGPAVAAFRLRAVERYLETGDLGQC